MDIYIYNVKYTAHVKDRGWANTVFFSKLNFLTQGSYKKVLIKLHIPMLPVSLWSDL